MSSLSTALRLHTPVLWVYAPEPFPWIDRLIEQADRPLFLYDPVSGLIGLDSETDAWKSVVRIGATMTEAGIKPILENIVKMDHVIDFVAKVNGIVVLYAADKMIDDFLGVLFSVYFKWRNKFYENELPTALPQFVLLASTPEVPPHIQSFTTLIDGSAPFGTSQLVGLIDGVDSNVDGGVFAEAIHVETVAKAASGMSEHTTIDTLFSSLFSTEGHKINPADVITRKAALLKASTTLDYHKPTISINDIAGLDAAKQMIRNSKWIMENPDEATKWGLDPLRRFLLVGIPGCGKSMISEAAATEFNLDLVKVGVARSLNKFIGESERNIREMFDQIERLAPIVAWDDEIGRDLAGGASSNYTDGGTTSRVHGEFLTRMQNLNEGVFFFGAANGLDHLSPEMLRAGRWDKILFVGFPAAVERHEIFRLNLERLEGAFDIERLVAATACWTGAEIASLIHETKNKIVPLHHRAITTDDIAAVISTTRNRIWLKSRTLVVESYKAAIDQYEWASTAQFADAAVIATGNVPGYTLQKKVTLG